MRRPRAILVSHWEALLTAALFLVCIYGAVAFLVSGDLGAAGYALFCAYGFFQALIAFLDAADLRGRMSRKQSGAEGLDG